MTKEIKDEVKIPADKPEVVEKDTKAKVIALPPKLNGGTGAPLPVEDVEGFTLPRADIKKRIEELKTGIQYFSDVEYRATSQGKVEDAAKASTMRFGISAQIDALTWVITKQK